MPHSHQLNPLLFPNIIKNVLRNFDDASQLAGFRVVCHSWNIEASCLLRNLKRVRFKSSDAIVSYCEVFKETEGTFGTFPHAHFDFSMVRTETCVDDLNIFFDLFGSKVTSLNLPVRTGTLEPFLLDECLRKIPNVRELALDFQYFQGGPILETNRYEFTPETIQNLQNVRNLAVQIQGLELSEAGAKNILTLLLQNMMNLQRISYPGDLRRISKVGLFLRDLILELDLEIASKLQNLGELEFKTRLLEEDALKFLCSSYPIRSLYVDLWNPEEEYSSISSELMGGLLRNWHKSLEKLSVDFPWRNEVSFHFNFPLPMENLKHLYLGGLEGSLLELLRKLPVLRRLELSQLELNSILPKPECTDEFHQVRHLRLDFCTGQSGGMMSRFSRIFPGLRSLNMNHATNEVARVIFQKMKGLTNLRMHGHDLTDSGMCGFSEALLKEKDLLGMTPTQGAAFRKYPYIADLKELRYLKLDAYGLSEVTVRHGLVHCTSLRLVKMDCTGGVGANSETTCRTFRLAEYDQHLVEEGKCGVVEIKEDPPLDAEALEFFSSHAKFSNDKLN